ncbi:hypothetical protein JHK87_050618 [Glycine soja]|nr:hypothetical protein JHK87_050618 [Glycine soja]
MLLSTLQTPRSLSRLTRHPHSFTSRASLTHQTQTLTPSSPSPPSQSEILSIRHALLSRHASAADLVLSQLVRLRLAEPRLCSFLHLPDDDTLLAHARRLDTRICTADLVKYNICTADMPLTVGSHILEGYRVLFDATAVKRVRELGGIDATASRILASRSMHRQLVEFSPQEASENQVIFKLKTEIEALKEELEKAKD